VIATQSAGSWRPRSASAATDLTVDHVVPLAAGGAPFHMGNTAVLCRSCNATKGAGDGDRGGVAHTARRLNADRAAIPQVARWQIPAARGWTHMAGRRSLLGFTAARMAEQVASTPRRPVPSLTQPCARTPATPWSPAS
jgi:hypothetical protein